jgi:hypothetical protein
MEESNNQGGENKPDKPQEGKQDAQEEGTQTLPQNPAQASLPANGVPNPIVPVLPIEAICVKVGLHGVTPRLLKIFQVRTLFSAMVSFY